MIFLMGTDITFYWNIALNYSNIKTILFNFLDNVHDSGNDIQYSKFALSATQYYLALIMSKIKYRCLFIFMEEKRSAATRQSFNESNWR